MNSKKSILAAVALASAGALFATSQAQAGPLVITTSTDGEALANNLVADTGVTIVPGSVQISSGTNEAGGAASGFFSGGEGILPFASGIVLSSGDVRDLPGPNDESGATTDFNMPGDGDLSTIVGDETNDAAVLIFQFIPNTDVISFQFVFGSEEYNEFIGSSFNDVFAFIVNGTNIALVPGTNDRITVNNVHDGVPDDPDVPGDDSIPAKNGQFYLDNTGDARNTELDGLVGVESAFPLFATTAVNAGQVNTIKIAIADTSDSILDSAIFLKASSFISEPPPGPGPGPGPNPIPLPPAVWAGLSLLGGLGVKRSLSRKA